MQRATREKGEDKNEDLPCLLPTFCIGTWPNEYTDTRGYRCADIHCINDRTDVESKPTLHSSLILQMKGFAYIVYKSDSLESCNEFLFNECNHFCRIITCRD